MCERFGVLFLLKWLSAPLPALFVCPRSPVTALSPGLAVTRAVVVRPN